MTIREYTFKANRIQCIECTEKHSSVAYYLLLESLQGYPEHINLVDGVIDARDTIIRLKAMLIENGDFRRQKIIGALSEAADECVLDFPELAERIRDSRIEYTITDNVNIEELLEEIENVCNSK